MSINKVILIGRLGQDPELKYTPGGSGVCNFSVATSESWTDKSGQRQERTEWHRIVVWGKLAELCHQYLAKGRQCFIEGSLQTRSWDGKDGQKRYTTEVVARNVQFLGAQQSTGSNYQQDQGMNQSSPSNDQFMNQDYEVKSDANFTADDIPF